MNDAPWYKDGLKFECTGCGDCCTGEPGHVWINKEEIAAMAAVVEMEIDQFQALYVRMIGIRKSLREYTNGDCVFFDSEARTCKVYDARPRQCGTWPFWDSNLRTEKLWDETCTWCPGCGKGKKHTFEEIEEQRKKIRV